METKPGQPSELDIRIGALQQEFNAHITLLSNRAATMASELAAAQAKCRELEVRLSEKQPEDKRPEVEQNPRKPRKKPESVPASTELKAA